MTVLAGSEGREKYVVGALSLEFPSPGKDGLGSETWREVVKVRAMGKESVRICFELRDAGLLEVSSVREVLGMTSFEVAI